MENKLVPSAEAKTYNIHETISLEGRVKLHLASNSRDSNAIPVIANPTNYVVKEPATMTAVHATEPERVEQSNGTGPEGEDVPDYTSDTRGRATEGVDRARVVMRFDVKRNGPTISNINYSSVRPWSNDYPGTLARQKSQQWFA